MFAVSLCSRLGRSLWGTGRTALLAGLLLTSTAPGQAAETIGTVARAIGPGQLAHPEAGTRAMAAGAAVQFGDVVATGAAAKAELVFSDQGTLTLGAETVVTVDAYVYQPGVARGAAMTLRRGVFRMLTAKEPGPANLTVHTPLGSIGVRGTDFWGEQTEDRLRLLLLSGGPIELTTATGRQVLREPGTLVEISRTQLQPSAPVRMSAEMIAAAAKTVALDP